MSSIITSQIQGFEIKFDSIPSGFNLETTTKMIIHIVKSFKEIYNILYDEGYYFLDDINDDGRKLKIAVGERYKFISNLPESETQFYGELDLEESNLYKLLKLDVGEATKIMVDYIDNNDNSEDYSIELHINRLRVVLDIIEGGTCCRTRFYYENEEYSDIYVIIKLLEQVVKKFFIIGSISKYVRLKEETAPINIFYNKLRDTVEISKYTNKNHDGEKDIINIIKQYWDSERENDSGPYGVEERFDSEDFY